MRKAWPLSTAALLSFALISGAASEAGAQSEIIDSLFSTCSTVGCDITSIASWAGTFGNKVSPWTAKFLAEEGNCLRLEVSFIRQSTANLEMVVIGPDAKVAYRNDDGSPFCANCPLVKIDPAPATGYYTAVISSNNGGRVDTDFHLLFGQYQPGNINCETPTLPLP
jgi:hypothetical protein